VGYIPRHDEDYAPSTLYGESKILTERIVRQGDGGGVTWCLVRPTTVWGPGMSAHFQRFFRYVYEGRYFHIGRSPVHQPYGYVENVVHQYIRLMTAGGQALNRRTFYLADYTPLSLRGWTEALKAEMGGPPLRTVPLPAARVLARIGDAAMRLGFPGFPLNTFRLRNLITEYAFDMTATEQLCGPLPFDVAYGVKQTVGWLRQAGIIPSRQA
jgi:nucleoside-diphosphate-sugar epimerase